MMADDDSESEHPTAAARAAAEKARDNNNRNKRLITGAAIGIGSAALVAALLYANRARKSDRS
jgi:hypothetical protein